MNEADLAGLDLVAYLAERGVSFRRGAGAELVAHCVFCGEHKRQGKLYLNTESWLYSCKVCGESGNQRTLMRHFGEDFAPGDDTAMLRRRVLTEYAAHAAELLAGNDKMMLYLLGRGLSSQTIIDAQLGYVPANYGICESLPGNFSRADLELSGMLTRNGKEFLAGKVTIPYFSHGSVVSVRGKDPSGKYLTAAGDQARLFSADSLQGATEVILTEGEFDALMVAQALAESTDPRLRRIAVVGLPGAGVLPGGAELFPELFSDAKRVFIALDPDEVGRREASKIRGIIGSKSRIVELPDSEGADDRGRAVKLDWSEFLVREGASHPFGGHGWRDVAELLLVADLTGKRIYSIGDAGARYQQEKADQPGLRLGFHTLDAIIAPGLKPGNLMIPLSKTGTGKSIYLANVAWNNRARRVLFVTLETTAPEVFLVLRRIARFWSPQLADHDLMGLMPHLRIVDENRLSPGDLDLLVSEYAEEVGAFPELLMVDYLGYYARGQRGASSYEKVSNAVMQLKAEAKRLSMAVISPHQVNRGARDGMPFDADEARDSGVVSETADFVLGLFRPGEAVDAVGGRSLDVSGALNVSVLKSRRGGKGKMVGLRTSAASLVIVDSTDRAAVVRVDQENALVGRGVSYDDIWAAERAAAAGRAQLRLAR